MPTETTIQQLTETFSAEHTLTKMYATDIWVLANMSTHSAEYNSPASESDVVIMWCNNNVMS